MKKYSIKDGRKRAFYALATAILLSVEVLIALFVHDRFVRPYIGDVIVVVVIYTFIRIWIPNGVKLLPLYVFLFAFGVEILQYFEIVRRLGLENNRFLRVLLGSTFDVTDIVCYGVGGMLIMGVRWMIIYRRKK